MANVELDKSREYRIDYEIIVDAYNDDEVAMGWYYYLNDNLNFPFLAKWKKKNRKTGKLEEIEIKVLGMESEDDCLEDMYVEVSFVGEDDDILDTVSLSDIEAIEPDEKTKQALEDWHYWIGRGNQL